MLKSVSATTLSTRAAQTGLAAFKLRDYQQELLDSARMNMAKGARRVLAVLSTGGGKTPIAVTAALRAVEKGMTVLFIAHREELIRQAITAFRRVGLDPVVAGRDPGWQSAQVVVGMAQTLAKLVDRGDDIPQFNLTILDEAHHCAADQWDKVLNTQSGYHLGFTATPQRLDGKGLDDHYDVMVQGPAAQWLVDQGHLARIDAWADPGGIIAGTRSILMSATDDQIEADIGEYADNAVKTWFKRAYGLPTIAFVGGRRVGEYFASKYRAEGVDAAFVDGTMTLKRRTGIIDSYAGGETKILISCNLIDEGVDVPATACIQLLNRTSSLGQHFQRIGRGMRPKDGAPMVLLDMARNVEGTASEDGHGLPTDVVEWSLEGKPTTVQDQEREAKEKAEAEKKEAEVIAMTSGDVRQIAACIEDCASYNEARRFVKRPEDMLKVFKHCKTKAGRRYSLGWVIRETAHRFFFNKNSYREDWTNALCEAAEWLGKERYADKAIRAGYAWTTPPSNARSYLDEAA